MPTILVNLKIDELSLVDKGANQHARVVIMKSLTFNPLVPFNPLMGHPPRDKVDASKAEERTREAFARKQVQPTSRQSDAEESRLGRRLDDDKDTAIPPRNFDEAVDRQRRATPRMSRTAAMSKARRDYPDLYKQFQEARAAAAVGADCINSAVVKFQKLVDEVHERTGCPRTVAMAAVRKRHPEEFRALRQLNGSAD